MTSRALLQALPIEGDTDESATPSLPEDLWTYTPDFLGLSYWRTIACHKSEYDYKVIAEPLTLPECPDCDHPETSLRPTGTLVRSVKDEPRAGRRVEIHFLRQRFQCPCGRNLLQPLPGVVEGRSITVRGAAYAATECFHRPFSHVAEKVGISSGMAKELFADLICGLESARAPEPPEILGIDGVCVGRRKYKRSYCLLTDLSNSGVFELLNKSTELELTRYITQLPDKEKIKRVVIDMAKGFLNVVELLLPGAEVSIDPYHVLSKLNDAVTKVVRMRQEGMTSAEHKQLMKGGNRFLLLKRRFELTEKEKEKLDAWFVEVPEFKLAYDLKEAGYDIYKSSNRKSAEKNFKRWEASIPETLKPAFSKFLSMVQRWHKYIFNYFNHKISNAFTESTNRHIKSIQRDGRRTSFAVLRARLLFADVGRLPARPAKYKILAQDIRQAMKKADDERHPPQTWDPNSYVARINNARKDKNEFSRLMRPGKGWVERFGHFSSYSKEKCTHKWDFIWPVEGRPKKPKD